MHGIGGNTIAKAKENISLDEARRWADYIARHGSLNVARHIERGFALLSHLTCVSGKIKIDGKIPSMESLMPHYVEGPISLEAAMSQWT